MSKSGPIRLVASSAKPNRVLPAPKSDFIGLEGKVHLATGGEPPLLKAHRDGFERFSKDKSEGFNGYHNHWRVVDSARGQLARLIHLEASDIALVANASEGIMKVVSSFDWVPGDNVVVSELDYASGRYALASVKGQGVELRLVPGEGWTLAPGPLLDACDDRTRLVYVSQVNALTGQHVDVAALSQGLAGSPAALMVDASHALGVTPVDGRQCDFLVSCCYKFLLGVHDGVLGWNRRRWPDFTPSGVGWHGADPGDDKGSYRPKEDARRAEFGNVSHLGAYLLQDSLAYLESFGIDAIAAHTSALSGALVAGMAALNLDVMTPSAPESRAANAAFLWPDPERLVRKAAAEGILVWGDNGRIRASAHLFTTPEDVERFLARLPIYIR